MNPGAGVTSLAALHDWYASLAAFRTEAGDALATLAVSLRQAADWLDEQQDHWRRQIRACEEDVTQAKAELRQRRQFLDPFGRPPDSTVQEKNLRRAQAGLEAAQDRLEAVRRWTHRLPREITSVYDGPAGRLSHLLDADLPRGLALLSRQLTALEQYVNLRAGPAPAPTPEPPKEKP
jgi:hypothetical protein